MTTDTTKLRELAQAARPGPWERDICQIDKMWLKGRSMTWQKIRAGA